MTDKNRKLYWRVRITICGYGTGFRAKAMFDLEDRLWVLLGGDA